MYSVINILHKILNCIIFSLNLQPVHRSPSMAFHKVGFFMDQYSWKLELPDNFYLKSPNSDFNKICVSVYGTHEKVCLSHM
jgi:hypothetical protein